MRILFDNGTPKPISTCLTGHEVTYARKIGWLTTDKNIRYQQNLTGRKIALVVLGNQQWPIVRLYLDRIAAAVNACTPGSYSEVEIPLS
jgi:vancomycin permeability regulator SanA